FTQGGSPPEPPPPLNSSVPSLRSGAYAPNQPRNSLQLRGQVLVVRLLLGDVLVADHDHLHRLVVAELVAALADLDVDQGRAGGEVELLAAALALAADLLAHLDVEGLLLEGARLGVPLVDAHVGGLLRVGV